MEELLYDVITFTSCLLWLRATYRSSSDLDAKIHLCVWKWGRQTREYLLTESHSSFLPVLLLRIMKATVWWRLIRVTQRYLCLIRESKHTRVYLWSAVYYHFKCCSSHKGWFLIRFVIYVNPINHNAPRQFSPFCISRILCNPKWQTAALVQFKT